MLIQLQTQQHPDRLYIVILFLQIFIKILLIINKDI